MAETILQTFLNMQFIKTSDTDNIESLKKAVNVLKKNLANKKHLIIPYTLVALDPQISETEPIVSEVETTIIKNWSTFKNSTSTKDKATTYVRVVILQALAEIASDQILGAIIWLTARNVVSYYQLQKEHESVSEMLTNIGSQCEVNSRKYWSMNTPFVTDLEEVSAKIPPLNKNVVEENTIINLFKNASVYKGWKANADGFGENPSYVHAGDWNWSVNFSEKAGDGLTKIINNIAGNQNKALTTAMENIQNEYFNQFRDFFTEVSKAIKQNAEANNMRGDLLWWKQTLRSPSLETSYRNQPEILSAMAMAYDLSQLIGHLYPESVNYLLREALRDVFGNMIDEVRSFEFWFGQAEGQSAAGAILLSSLENSSTGRKSLSAVLANTMIGQKPDSLLQETGIEANSEITLSDLTVWILHDLQAKKISLLK